jgi:hypothetical protein
MVLNARAHPSGTGHRALLPRRRTLSKPAARTTARIRYSSDGPPRISPGTSRRPITPRKSHPISPVMPKRTVPHTASDKAVQYSIRLSKALFSPALAGAHRPWDAKVHLLGHLAICSFSRHLPKSHADGHVTANAWSFSIHIYSRLFAKSTLKWTAERASPPGRKRRGTGHGLYTGSHLYSLYALHLLYYM